jgi:hypothetical protein
MGSGAIVVVGATVVVGAGSITCSWTRSVEMLTFPSSVEHEYAMMMDAIAMGMAKSFEVMGFMRLRCSGDRNGRVGPF